MAGIYIHVPFCKRKCPYCNFFSTDSFQYGEGYAEAVNRELEQRKGYFSGAVHTIYFGGGSPSLLAAKDIEKIMDQIYKHYRVQQEGLEVTMEANPDDITPSLLKGFRAAGINRLSLGVQSFFSQDLSYLERQHKVENVCQALQWAEATGFNNISADLIYGIPGQTTRMLTENVNRLLQYPVTHISAYALTVEEGTPLKAYIGARQKEGVSPHLAARHFLYLSGYLKGKGMEHYEVSNYAFPGMHSRHNSNYWLLKPYLGAGPSAHSYNGTERSWNVSSVEEYMRGIRDNHVMAGREMLTVGQMFNEYVMLRLRTCRGINLQEVAGKFGRELHNNLIRRYRKLPGHGLSVLENNHIRLTAPGLLHADGLAARLFEDES